MNLEKVEVVSTQYAKNGDLVLGIQCHDVENISPGQYFDCSLHENGDIVVSAYVFSIKPKSNVVELYIFSPFVQSLKTLDTLFVSEPKGQAFTLPDPSNRPVLLADEWGLPAIIFLARIIKTTQNSQPLVFLYSASEFPFIVKPSQFLVSGLPAGMLGACPMLEDFKIPSRLISRLGLPGCFDGEPDDFWQVLTDDFKTRNVEIFLMGKHQYFSPIIKFCEREKVSKQIIALNNEYNF